MILSNQILIRHRCRHTDLKVRSGPCSSPAAAQGLVRGPGTQPRCHGHAPPTYHLSVVALSPTARACEASTGAESTLYTLSHLPFGGAPAQNNGTEQQIHQEALVVVRGVDEAEGEHARMTDCVDSGCPCDHTDVYDLLAGARYAAAPQEAHGTDRPSRSRSEAPSGKGP